MRLRGWVQMSTGNGLPRTWIKTVLLLVALSLCSAGQARRLWFNELITSISLYLADPPSTMQGSVFGVSLKAFSDRPELKYRTRPEQQDDVNGYAIWEQRGPAHFTEVGLWRTYGDQALIVINDHSGCGPLDERCGSAVQFLWFNGEHYLGEPQNGDLQLLATACQTDTRTLPDVFTTEPKSAALLEARLAEFRRRTVRENFRTACLLPRYDTSIMVIAAYSDLQPRYSGQAQVIMYFRYDWTRATFKPSMTP